MTFSARVGPTVGLYQVDSTATVTNLSTGESATGRSDDAWESAFGLQAGFGGGMGNFFGDIAIEYLDVNSDAVDKRTDVLLTGGYLIGQHWSAFAGYRRGMQGDSAFNDDNFDESGFFVGAGIGGVEMGPVLFGASAAYNFSKVDNFVPGEKFDYQGISLKVSAAPKSMPQHSLQLRYQRFNGDGSPNFDLDGDGVDDININFDLTESYVQLTYAYAFVF
ncbi:hypothetical protein AAG565_08760 [Fontimonas sp. SYSU GA230001]|uniref:hypothetical protein n=1 Tax=Fontimonas sp. SYSU GA230001 TaxID=3142450 RepID=UPI0032B58239